MKLSIIIPAYNEEARIRPMLDAYSGFFCSRYGTDVEFIVVVNGSTDRTEDIVQECIRKCPQIRHLVEKRVIGKGGAIVMGFRQACGELIGFVDADNATPPEAFQDLVDNIGNAGAIIASRWRKESKVSPRQPASRLIASRAFNTMVRILFGMRFTDTQCGAKLMTRQAAQDILPFLGLTRWAFDVDLLFQLRRVGYPIIEWPTTWRDVAGSRLQVSRAAFEMIIAIIRLRMLYSPLKWIIQLYDVSVGRFIKLRV